MLSWVINQMEFGREMGRFKAMIEESNCPDSGHKSHDSRDLDEGLGPSFFVRYAYFIENQCLASDLGFAATALDGNGNMSHLWTL